MSNCPASSLTTTASHRKPCAATAPHSAPSVAMRTGSGVTNRSAIPSCSRSRPRALIGKPPLQVRGQWLDHRSGQRVVTHVVEGSGVDYIVGVTGAQQVEEVQSALAA